MKRSEAFRKAQIAVLGSDMLISEKVDVLGFLMWEEHWARCAEEAEEAKEKENATL
jgi:hypothetical protein